MGVSVIASHHDFEQTPSPEVMKMLLMKSAPAAQYCKACGDAAN